jgi:hypothetical protein
MAALLPYLALAGAAAAPELGKSIGSAASGGIQKLRDYLHFQRGGYVSGRRPVQAVLHPGELVIPRAVVNSLMNRRGMPGPKPKAAKSKTTNKKPIRKPAVPAKRRR